VLCALYLLTACGSSEQEPVQETVQKRKATKKKFPKGEAGVYKILPAGPTSDEVAANAEAMYEGLKDKNIVTDVDASSDLQSDDL
jgi:hypothetical protein